MVPSAYDFPEGCRLIDAFASDACLEEPPIEEWPQVVNRLSPLA